MKRTLILATVLALSLFTSCRKEHDWLCTIEQTTPEGTVYHTSVVVPFRGTLRDMRAYEKTNTFGTVGVPPAWQTCKCK